MHLKFLRSPPPFKRVFQKVGGHLKSTKSTVVFWYYIICTTLRLLTTHNSSKHHPEKRSRVEKKMHQESKPNKLAWLICKAGLSLCKRDALGVLLRPRNKHFPSPLTGKWQLFKCKLSLTNTTLCDTCFNHGNKGAASGRARAPLCLWYSNDGEVQKVKNNNIKRVAFAEREEADLPTNRH